MDDNELRDIITTARLEMLIRASKYEREGQPAQAQGIRAAIEILDYHIKRVYDASASRQAAQQTGEDSD